MIISFFPPMCCHYRVLIFSKAYRQITKSFESGIVKYLKATKHLLLLQRKFETQLLCFERSQAGGLGRGSAGLCYLWLLKNKHSLFSPFYTLPRPEGVTF